MDNLNGVIETNSLSGKVSGSSKVSSGVARSNRISGAVVDDENMSGAVNSTNRLSGIVGVGSGSTPITIDDFLSLTSTNPVQNRIITAALQGLSEYDVVYSNSTATYTIGTTSTITSSVFPYNIPDTGDLVITAGGYLGRVESASGNSFSVAWLPPYLSDRLVAQNNIDNETQGFFPLLMAPNQPTSGSASEAYYRSAIGVSASSGELSAPSFSGSGANLTNLNASALTSGTVPVARLPAEATTDEKVRQSPFAGSEAATYPVLLAGSTAPNGLPLTAKYSSGLGYMPMTGVLFATVSGQGTFITNIPAGNIVGQLPVASGGTGAATAPAAVVNLGFGVGGIPKVDANGNITRATPADLAAVEYNTVVFQGDATPITTFGTGVDEVLPSGSVFLTTAPANETPKVGDAIISSNGYIGTIKAIDTNNTTATWMNKVLSLTGYVTGTKLVLISN